MILYLDTSAILKLYFEERSSAVVHQAVAAAQIITLPPDRLRRGTRCLAAKFRERKLNAKQAAACREDFQRDWSCFEVMR